MLCFKGYILYVPNTASNQLVRRLGRGHLYFKLLPRGLALGSKLPTQKKVFLKLKIGTWG